MRQTLEWVFKKDVHPIWVRDIYPRCVGRQVGESDVNNKVIITAVLVTWAKINLKITSKFTAMLFLVRTPKMETRRDSLGSQIGWKRFLAATCSASDVSAFCLSKPLPVFCCLSNGRQMKWSEETWFFTRWAFRSFTSSSREKNRSETFPPTRERGNCLFPDWARQNWLKRRWRETTAIKTTKTTLSKSFLLRRQDAITHSLVRPSVENLLKIEIKFCLSFLWRCKQN